MTVINAIRQSPFKSQRRLDNAIFNATRFKPGTIPPILPYLNICNAVPNSSVTVHNSHQKASLLQDDWVFQGIAFYAHPKQESHPDYANKPTSKRNRWTMDLLERNPSTGKTRVILLEPTFNPQGQLHGFTMCLELEDAASPMTWAIKQLTADAIPYTSIHEERSGDFYHWELVAYLFHRGCQLDYMRVLPADRTGFFLNIARLLVQLRVLDRSVVESLIQTVEGMVSSSSDSSSQPPELPTTVSPSMLLKKH